MIEVDETRLSHFLACIQRERLAADAARNEEAREIHIRLMHKYERQLAALTGIKGPSPTEGFN